MSQPDQPNDFISFSPPCLGDEEIDEVIDTLRSPWITTGPKVRQFEQEFASMTGAPEEMGVNSCTSALELALEALGIGKGDEVITTTLTFAATVNVIERRGARPVLVDVEPDTLNIDPQCVADAITPKTAAIIPVHFAGHPVEMTPLIALAGRHNLAIVEDAAHALPAAYHGEKVGGSSRLTAFSFYATKNYTTTEGGMLTGDPKLLERARIMSLHGMSRNAWARYSEKGSWFYEVIAPGFKCNMTDVQAAIGLHQIKKMDCFQTRRQEIWQTYNDAFAGRTELQTPTIRGGIDHAMHLYVLRLTDEAAISRNDLIESLKEQRIGTSVHFIPIHLHPYYRDTYGLRAEDFPVALSNFHRMLSLPLNVQISNDQVRRVVDAVLGLTSSASRTAA